MLSVFGEAWTVQKSDLAELPTTGGAREAGQSWSLRANLSETVRETCRLGRILAQAKQIGFREQIAASPLIVEGDTHALQRLFLILVNNAVKYAPLGATSRFPLPMPAPSRPLKSEIQISASAKRGSTPCL